jgi:hypothetical protein
MPEHLRRLFEANALALYRKGRRRCSARSILHKIRDDGFKCDDHWSPRLARWFLRAHPEIGAFFELRGA